MLCIEIRVTTFTEVHAVSTMVLLRPRERIILNAIKNENTLKRRAKHMQKRFRSWSQQRIRQYWMPLNVSLVADPQLMDGQYIAACVQKAAGLRKHDIKLWKGYSKRILELANTLSPLQLGYIFYGCGKSYFLDEQLYRGLVPSVCGLLPNFHSHALMCIAWALDRVHIREDELFEMIGKTVLLKAESIRSSDLIKICNSLGRMGANGMARNAEFSKMVKNKYDKTFAQEFRNAMCDVTILNLYDDELKHSMLCRFAKIFICARPQHYQQAFQTAVALRVLYPNVWYSLPKQIRSFYIRLSMRRIPQISRYPSNFHWDVSNCLAKLGIAHRNTFQWGCYWIDMGETEERRNCWFIDGPTSFYFNTNQYLETKKLHHRVLNHLGWNIRRVCWQDWVEFGGDTDAKLDYLRKVRESNPLSGELMDGPLQCENLVHKLKMLSLCKTRGDGVKPIEEIQLFPHDISMLTRSVHSP
ncbi:RAP domain-containing protein [Cardiosporidium cionae]|uniref:RAP domain-containing protein n=1 Tax=Cardiosporidium cionae TaxID=476202 RepID=A0ABQ7J6U9_9APIC|nr:RAP domain-containing protein [Cardiosporidium cionae]|eukprot:KAF8819716.1 RAP domain-containing protein [Cardiosporidium cionae]